MSRFTAVLFLLLMVVGAQNAHAQQWDETQFGIVSDSLMNLQPPQEYANAPYMITSKERNVSFREEDGSIMAVMDYHVRLKVFSDSARRASRVDIPYYFENNMEQVSNIRGRTYLPSGKQVALSPSEIRTININARYNVKEFRMPRAKKGAVLEYQYQIKRKYIEELPAFYLSAQVPTGMAQTTITYPRYLRYQTVQENVTVPVKKDIVFTDTSSVPKIFTIPQPKPVITERWRATNIAPTRKEAYISSLDNYRQKIKFMMNEFGVPRQTLENSWKVVAARLREKRNPLAVIRQNKRARAVGDSLANVFSSEDRGELQKRIYQYLNDRTQFSGAHKAYSETGDLAVLKGNTADQAAINQTLVAMLRGANIKADPVLISTRKSGEINKDFPSFYQFNGQLVQTEINGKKYLLDGSYSHSLPGLIATKSYNSSGFLLRKDDYRWVTIEPRRSEFNIQVRIDGKLDTGGDLAGSIATTQKGYTAWEVRRQLSENKSPKTILRQTLLDGYADITINNVSLRQTKEDEGAVKMSGKFRIKDYAPSFSNGLEFSPMVVGYRRQNPFKNKNRHLPITLDAPEKLDVAYHIELPTAHKPEDDFSNQQLKFAGGQFSEKYKNTQKQLNYRYQIDISNNKFAVSNFSKLYQLYERWVQLSNSTWLIKDQN